MLLPALDIAMENCWPTAGHQTCQEAAVVAAGAIYVAAVVATPAAEAIYVAAVVAFVADGAVYVAAGEAEVVAVVAWPGDKPAYMDIAFAAAVVVAASPSLVVAQKAAVAPAMARLVLLAASFSAAVEDLEPATVVALDAAHPAEALHVA